MSKISFIISEARLHEHLSIMSLSASLKKAGHDVSLVFFQHSPFNKDKIVEAIREEAPDFVGMSFMSGFKEHYVSLASHIKDKLDLPIMIGGPAATFDMTFVNGEETVFDAVCIGEGDISIVEFVNNYRMGKLNKPVSNFIINSPGKNDTNVPLLDLVDPLDDLPFPDRDIIYDKDSLLRNSKIKMFMSGRGCPYKCTYCFNHKYNDMYKGKGKVIRKKSVDYFIEEIEQVRKKYPLEGIIFEDDILIISKPWMEEFAEKYSKKIGLPFKCYVRPNLVDKDMAKLLKKSGCYSTQVAVECGNESLRNTVLKRNMTDEQIISCCKTLHEENLKVGTINILGLPTETASNMKETLALNRACEPDHVSANMFIPLPGVDLTNYAVEQGLLDSKYITPKSTHHISQLKYPEEIKNMLYSYKSLFPLMVRSESVEGFYKYLRKLPAPALKAIDSAFRLYSNARFHPPVSFSLRDKIRLARRYFVTMS